MIERAKRAIEALRKPDASLARVVNTVRQSIAEVIEHQQILIDVQADRIEALEAALATCRELREYDRKTIGHLPPPIARDTISALCEKTDKQRIRIEALEAALRVIAEQKTQESYAALIKIARVALSHRNRTNDRPC